MKIYINKDSALPNMARERSIRSLMRSGGSIVVSLPREWVERLGLSAGESVVIEPADDSLVLSPLGRRRRGRSLHLRLGSDIPLFISKVTAAYLLGYDLIELEIPESAKKVVEEALTSVKNRLLGLEALEGAGGRLALRVLIDPTSLKPVEVLRRMWRLSTEALQDSITAMLEDDVELARLVIRRDDEMDRLYFYIVRLLRSCASDPTLLTRLNLTSINVLDYRLVAYLLENINDRAAELAELVEHGAARALNKAFRERLADSGKLLAENQDDAMRVFLNREIDLLEKVRERTKIIKTKLASANLTSLKPQIHEIISNIARMQHDIADLAQIPL